MTTPQTWLNLQRLGGEEPGGLLRLALKLDAAASGALGVLALVASPVLADVLGAPVALLAPVGVFLTTFAASLWFAASRPNVSRSAARGVVALNLLWVALSVVAVVAGWFSLTALGVAFFLVQAAAVVLFADVQFFGLRRLRPATP